MNHKLHKANKEGTLLVPIHTSYSDEYAQRMCDLYLSDEVHRNEEGRMQKYYRLHAKYDHTPEMALAYDIQCPDCHRVLKQVGRQNTLNELGLYICPVCKKR